MMPGMNGLELTEFARILSPNSQIIVLSGLENDQLNKRLVSADADHDKTNLTAPNLDTSIDTSFDNLFVTGN